MPNWTRLRAPAAGAFSATWITRIGALVFALILGGAFLMQSCFATVPTDPESLIESEEIAGDRAGRQLGQRVQDIEQRAALDAAAAERELAATGAQLTGAHVTPAFDPTTGETLPDGAADPIAGDGLGWRDDFTGTDTAGLIDALEAFSTTGTPVTGYWRDRLRAAPVTTEADVIAEYNTLPVSLADRAAENYRRQRNQGERRTALSHSVNTAASDATATVLTARNSYAELRGQTNVSGTALQQAQIAGLITGGEVSAALLQLHAFEANQRAAEALAAEERRRELEAARVETLRAARAQHDRRIAGIESHRDGGDSLLFAVP